MTDPEVGRQGEAPPFPPTYPLAWVSAYGAEIGDLCACQEWQVLGYTVQLERSTSLGHCLTLAVPP